MQLFASIFAQCVKIAETEGLGIFVHEMVGTLHFSFCHISRLSALLTLLQVWQAGQRQNTVDYSQLLCIKWIRFHCILKGVCRLSRAEKLLGLTFFPCIIYMAFRAIEDIVFWRKEQQLCVRAPWIPKTTLCR